MKLTEGHIHIAVRRFLKRNGWQLIAGEYPGGSDDELYALCIVDPEVACDSSPDPRRHSKGEIIPDIIAYKDGVLLIVEAKPKYNIYDKEKLLSLLTIRYHDLIIAIAKFAIEKNMPYLLPVSNLHFTLALAFSYNSNAPIPDIGFVYIRVKSLDDATWQEGESR